MRRMLPLLGLTACNLGLFDGPPDSSTDMKAASTGTDCGDTTVPTDDTDPTDTDTTGGTTGGTTDDTDTTDDTGGGPSPASEGIWISEGEIMALPMSGDAWDNVLDFADSDGGSPDLSDQDQDNNHYVLAKALVYVRTGEDSYRDEVVEQLMSAIGTEQGGRTLALGRELVAYVVAADLIGLDGADDEAFRSWLEDLLTEELDGRTLQSTHEDRPNNWGTHAGASRMAVAVYLGDEAELERSAQVFKGWVGDRSSYADFEYDDDLSWQADPDAPVGINPAGSEIDGVNVDGAQPEDMRRGGSFDDPPGETGYPWEALQGAIVQAEILHRQGYDAWDWEDQAIQRAAEYLYDLDDQYGGWAAEGDDEWQTWLINKRTGTSFPTLEGARGGKNMGFTDWTHAP